MPHPGEIRILVVDDHFIVRMGLVALINTEPNLKVVGEADNGEQAVQRFESLRPDVVLMDLRMPGTSANWSLTRACSCSRPLMATATFTPHWKRVRMATS
jgi:DNA-binding NarL/FixJ family response regulator